jgi:hypothetical protein
VSSIFFDTKLSDEKRREHLYNGQIFVYGTCPSAIAMSDFAREMIEEAFAPVCQLNWWLPIYEVEPDNIMAFHPRYWSQSVKNSSSGYNYHCTKKDDSYGKILKLPLRFPQQ